jgi:uncharacterized membrane protein YdbT with pleckstrin-like domain
MFCTKCGTENSDSAAFCRRCGTALDAEEETRIAARSGGSEISTSDKVLFSVSPTVKFVMAGYGLAVIAAFLLVALLSAVLPAVSTLVAIVLGLLILLVPAYFHLRQKLVRYSLTETTIEIDRGLISRTTQNVPLRRIQDVTVTSTLFQRVLGFGDIVVDNASESGGKVILDNIDSPRKYANLLLEQMRKLDS